MFEEGKEDCSNTKFISLSNWSPVFTNQYLMYGSIFIWGINEVQKLPYERFASYFLRDAKG